MPKLSWWQRLQRRAQPTELAAVTAQVDDGPGWWSLSDRPHDHPPAQVVEIYQDALTVWRSHPFAWRIIGITTDFVIGDGLKISSPQRSLNRFITRFWDHPQNRMALRLEPLCDELSRAGDLFVVLFRNPADGMSYLRLLTKDRIVRIETAENDWERELAYYEKQEAGEPRRWLSPLHPEAPQAEAVVLHYAINRPAGALLGESDLTTLLPWLLRYARMLEDRVRLHWAMRLFLWVVNVPSGMVKAKQEEYRNPPDSGSVVVKDDGENWQALAPNLHGSDARHDLQAVRQMIDAGSGYPPHWRGEPGDANLATATAMQGPTERHLIRRQRYFVFMLQDILYQAYRRAAEVNAWRRLPDPDYTRLFTVVAPEVSRWDNESLARAAGQLAQAMESARGILGGDSGRFKRLALQLILQFAGAPQMDETIDAVLAESEAHPVKPPVSEVNP
jgi:hypothetical protein